MNLTISTFLSPRSDRFPDTMAFLAWVILCLIAVKASGTGDDGDSVSHYLYSRYAFEHPENFFNHWAKPLFVMLTAPVAYFGITAMKLFNASMLGLQIFMNIRIARRLNMSLLWLIPLMSLAVPYNITHTLSGLTEPMFATVLSGAILLMLSGRTFWAYILFSFLPMIRSEGLIIMCPLLIYLVWCKHFKYLPLFIIGHLVVGLLGFSLYGNVWWTITQNPYAGGNSGYGSGRWDHFITSLPYIIGSILTFLLVLGLLSGLYRLILKGGMLRSAKDRDEAWMIYGLFLAYFIAHSIFWWQGLFASYGLLRVMLCVMPCIVLICLRGIHLIDMPIIRYMPKARSWMAIIFIPVLWFNLVQRVSWRGDLMLNASQKAMRKAIQDVRAKSSDPSNITWYTDAPDAALATGEDYFDRGKFREGSRLFSHEPIPPNSIILWDNHFMPFEGQVKLEELQNDPRFEHIGTFKETEHRGRWTNQVQAFAVKPAFTCSSDPGWSYEWKFDTMKQSKAITDFAGRRCLKVDRNAEFAFGFKSFFGSFPAEAKFAISFDLSTSEPGPNIPGTLVFACSTWHDDYLWIRRDLKDPNYVPGQWKHYSFEEKLPKGRGDRDKFMTYVWNPSEKPIYLHNFRIERIE